MAEKDRPSLDSQDKKSMQLLIENNQMSTFLASLRMLMERSEGVILDGELVTWEKALPASTDLPSSNCTDSEVQRWMEVSITNWARRFNKGVQQRVESHVTEESTVINDNIYLLTLFSSINGLIPRLLPFLDNDALARIDPEAATDLQETRNTLASVSGGVASTSSIRTDIFRAGSEDAVMSLRQSYERKVNAGMDATWLLNAIDVVRAGHTDSLDAMDIKGRTH